MHFRARLHRGLDPTLSKVGPPQTVAPTHTQSFLTSDHRIVRIYQLDALALDVEDVVGEHVVAQPSIVNLDFLGSGV